jgi:hypothetical protein
VATIEKSVTKVSILQAKEFLQNRNMNNGSRQMLSNWTGDLSQRSRGLERRLLTLALEANARHGVVAQTRGDGGLEAAGGCCCAPGQRDDR